MLAVLSLINEDFLKLLDHSYIPLKRKSHNFSFFRHVNIMAANAALTRNCKYFNSAPPPPQITFASFNFPLCDPFG